MTNVNRLRSLKFGLHASISDFTSSPTTAVIQPMGDGASFLPRPRDFIDRPLASPDGRRFPTVRGKQDIAELSLHLEFRGINSNTGGAVSDWEAKMEQGAILSSFFGADAAATSGAATTVDSSGHTPASGILAAVDASDIDEGGVIAFASTAGLQIGRVADVTSNDVTLTSAYSGTPTTGATIFRLPSWVLDTDKTEHIPGFFDAEMIVDGTGNVRRTFNGCFPSTLELVFPDSGKVEFNTTWMPSGWAAPAPADPAFAAPTAGNPIVNDGYRVRIGDEVFVARNARFSLDNTLEMRPAGSNTNGVAGGVCGTGEQGKVAMFTVELYFGGGGAIAEILGASGTPDLGDLTGDDDSAGDVSPTYDLSFAFGSEIGACGMIHMANAELQARMVAGGAFPMVSITAYATGVDACILAVG